MSNIELLPADERSIRRAAAALRRGAVIAYPTDTVYGVGALVDRPDALRRLFAIKGRPADKPLPVLIADLSQIAAVARALPPKTWCLAARFWPGGLTLVLPAASALSPVVTGGLPTVGVRVPAHDVPRTLIRLAGAPLVGTSANLAGEPSSRTAAEVAAQLGDRVDLILDAGTAPGGVESTVIDLTTDPPRLLRPGAVPLESLRVVCPELAIGPA